MKKRSPADKKQVSRRRMMVFKTIAFLSPFAILVFLEMILRVVHYGNDLSLFLEHPTNPGYLIFNPNAAKRYFSNQQLATVGTADQFKKHKDAGVKRIFVLGESTAVGYPYYYNGSFDKWLKYRLRMACPDQRWEVINLALTAVNSYTVLGFAKEVVDYQPDAVLIYTGHNEYYGCMGVASTDRISGDPFWVNMVLFVRGWRITQFISQIVDQIKNTDHALTRETRMRSMVASAHIPLGSNLYQKGIEQYERNINKLLAIFSDRGVPVFISNLVSNEKDLRPFISIPANDPIQSVVDLELAKGEKETSDTNDSAAMGHFANGYRLDSGYALSGFLLGTSCLKNGQPALAKYYFDRARELDGLRFRAPEAFNTSLKKLCSKYPNTKLVDVEQRFEMVANHRILGDELIVDHVHPGLMGYALMSDAFYSAMKTAGFISACQVHETSLADLIERMPLTKLDTLAGQYRISFLKNSWPFSDGSKKDSLSVATSEEQLAWMIASEKVSWKLATEELFSKYVDEGRSIQALKAIEALALQYPQDITLLEKAAMLCANLNQYAKAAMYFRDAFELEPSFDRARYIFAFYLKLDDPARALPFLDYAIANNVSGLNLRGIKTKLGELAPVKLALAMSPDSVGLLNKIALIYLEMGNQDGALPYIKRTLVRDPKNKEALAMLSSIKS